MKRPSSGKAFRRGRQAVADPDALARVVAPTVPDKAAPALTGSELDRIVGVRVPELVAYQDEAYAARYVADVERVRAAEERAVPGSTVLAEAVATHLFTLMAYKEIRVSTAGCGRSPPGVWGGPRSSAHSSATWPPPLSAFMTGSVLVFDGGEVNKL